MEPVTIILAIVGVVVGFGVNQSMTKKKLGSAEAEAEKQQLVEYGLTHATNASEIHR